MPGSPGPALGLSAPGLGVSSPACLEGAPRGVHRRSLMPCPALPTGEQGREHTGISASREWSQMVWKSDQVIMDIVLRQCCQVSLQEEKYISLPFFRFKVLIKSQ